jgi:hypothetical protein
MAALFAANPYFTSDLGARLRLVVGEQGGEQESSGAEVGWVALLPQDVLLCPILFRPHSPMSSGSNSRAQPDQTFQTDP